MKKTIFIFLQLFILLWTSVAHSDMAKKFTGMEGWTIIAVTQVERGVEGCKVDKEIKFINGMTLKCSTFSHFYSFMPEAVIFAKETNYKDMEFYQIKALIGNEFYDMAPELIK